MAAKGLFYHIALIDSSLTDIGVDELARLVHHDVTLNNLELVKLNSFEQSETGRNNNSELFSKHLYKPVRQSNLLDCLTQVTQGTKSEEQTSILNTDEAEKVQATYSSRRILLVEDNPVNQKLTVKQLEKLGYTSEVAENGMKALDLHSKSDYDLILMDCQMPEMDGYATTRLIRQSENGSGNHIPIVALTADALLGDREKCLEVGMDDYLSKPVSISQLRHVLERWLVDENRDITKMPANEPTNIETSQNSGSRTPVVNQTLPVSGEPVLRYQVLADLRSIQDPQSPDLVNEVIDLFLENSPGWMEELREAISKLEYIKIYQTAHRLKGASSNLGAVAFASVCYKLEKMGKECSFEGLEKQITNLENTYEQLREALQTVKI
jgi:CheY-like chemotaxis protein/HPt (histidine-containing phosphotransfer) domain-containing protein